MAQGTSGHQDDKEQAIYQRCNRDGELDTGEYSSGTNSGASAVLTAFKTVASATLPPAINTSNGDEMSVGRTPTSV